MEQSVWVPLLSQWYPISVGSQREDLALPTLTEILGHRHRPSIIVLVLVFFVIFHHPERVMFHPVDISSATPDLGAFLFLPELHGGPSRCVLWYPSTWHSWVFLTN